PPTAVYPLSLHDALPIYPSSPIAEQELRKTLEAIAEANRPSDAAAEEAASEGGNALASMPPEIKPLSRAPINLKMSNEAKLVFEDRKSTRLNSSHVSISY